jgi:hypothetical protein
MLANVIKQRAQDHDPEFLTILWGTIALKVIAGLLALALVRPWGRVIPRWLLLTATWGAGALLVLYGDAGLVEASLMEAVSSVSPNPWAQRRSVGISCFGNRGSCWGNPVRSGSLEP